MKETHELQLDHIFITCARTHMTCHVKSHKCINIMSYCSQNVYCIKPYFLSHFLIINTTTNNSLLIMARRHVSFFNNNRNNNILLILTNMVSYTALSKVEFPGFRKFLH